MIDIELSLDASLKRYIDKMRFIGFEDKLLKKYLMIIIISKYVYSWKDQSIEDRMKLESLINSIFMKSICVDITSYTDNTEANTNTGQSVENWRNFKSIKNHTEPFSYRWVSTPGTDTNTVTNILEP